MAQNRTAPFAPFEWMIAWRYLRARRAEGGVSVMTWISLIGITLAVFALIATLSVRSGFRAEFVDTILGANAHVTVYQLGEVAQNGQIDRSIADYKDMAAAVAQVPGVIRAADRCLGDARPGGACDPYGCLGRGAGVGRRFRPHSPPSGYGPWADHRVDRRHHGPRVPAALADRCRRLARLRAG